jgi:hypothetical protein
VLRDRSSQNRRNRRGLRKEGNSSKQGRPKQVAPNTRSSPHAKGRRRNRSGEWPEIVCFLKNDFSENRLILKNSFVENSFL